MELSRHEAVHCILYTPVDRRDVLWYADVRPSVRPSIRQHLHCKRDNSKNIFIIHFKFGVHVSWDSIPDEFENWRRTSFNMRIMTYLITFTYFAFLSLFVP